MPIPMFNEPLNIRIDKINDFNDNASLIDSLTPECSPKFREVLQIIKKNDPEKFLQQLLGIVNVFFDGLSNTSSNSFQLFCRFLNHFSLIQKLLFDGRFVWEDISNEKAMFIFEFDRCPKKQIVLNGKQGILNFPNYNIMTNQIGNVKSIQKKNYQPFIIDTDYCEKSNVISYKTTFEEFLKVLNYDTLQCTSLPIIGSTIRDEKKMAYKSRFDLLWKHYDFFKSNKYSFLNSQIVGFLHSYEQLSNSGIFKNNKSNHSQGLSSVYLSISPYYQFTVPYDSWDYLKDSYTIISENSQTFSQDYSIESIDSQENNSD